jgi:predicted peptidase
MSWMLASFLALALLGQPTASGLYDLTADVPEVGTVSFGLSVPRGYNPDTAVPLVVVLHPGGERTRYYGSAFTRVVVEPGLRDLGAVMLALDCPADSWSDPLSEKALLTLIAATMQSYTIDRRRVLVTGFSMGGSGTWFMGSRHPELFTASIPMAAGTGSLAAETLATMPTYVIHSRDDERVPFAPAERNARALERAGKPIRFEALTGLTHFEMVNYVDALRRGGRWVADRWKSPSR